MAALGKGRGNLAQRQSWSLLVQLACHCDGLRGLLSEALPPLYLVTLLTLALTGAPQFSNQAGFFELAKGACDLTGEHLHRIAGVGQVVAADSQHSDAAL